LRFSVTVLLLWYPGVLVDKDVIFLYIQFQELVLELYFLLYLGDVSNI